jgi:dCMP deaminase
MKLDHLFSLRNEFSVIGLTGRMGSGCTQIAELLNNDFENLRANGLRKSHQFSDPVFQRKYSICQNYLAHGNNWRRYDVISYKNVLLFFILNRYGGDRQKINELFSQFYKETREEDNKEIVFNVLKDILPIDAAFTHLINDIKTFHDFKDRMTDAE